VVRILIAIRVLIYHTDKPIDLTSLLLPNECYLILNTDWDYESVLKIYLDL
jgi:hypothetical protein